MELVFTLVCILTRLKTGTRNRVVTVIINCCIMYICTGISLRHVIREIKCCLSLRVPVRFVYLTGTNESLYLNTCFNVVQLI